RRVITLSDDVRKISEGDLKRNIATVHNDEIGKLAGSVDTMRNAILEKMDNEKAAWDANTQLITSMSHDIRTPLTSLIGYLDIIEGKKFNSYEELDKYIASCREKAFQLKDLSDKLFQYFLVFGNKDQGKNMEKLDAGILFQQILVEHVAEAISYGNNINLQYNIPEQVMVETDISSLRRLFDYLFSNIMKYANTKFAVEVKADVIRDKIKIVLQNHIWDEAKKVESTKIGVKTCKKICEDMNGTFKAMEEEKIYTTEILFPIVEGDEEEPEDEASANGTAEAPEYKS
ncbi:MAG: HAMP domain-containing histidine kinase, partial [Clostridiales bacterium]|nr:HAMP domain-containing histidine kinase [Clostridiales bacterium]